jgi:hypothetical protein
MICPDNMLTIADILVWWELSLGIPKNTLGTLETVMQLSYRSMY